MYFLGSSPLQMCVLVSIICIIALIWKGITKGFHQDDLILVPWKCHLAKYLMTPTSLLASSILIPSQQSLAQHFCANKAANKISFRCLHDSVSLISFCEFHNILGSFGSFAYNYSSQGDTCRALLKLLPQGGFSYQCNLVEFVMLLLMNVQLWGERLVSYTVFPC